MFSLSITHKDGPPRMEKFSQAVEAIGISPDIVHRAFDRYFAETMPGY